MAGPPTASDAAAPVPAVSVRPRSRSALALSPVETPRLSVIIVNYCQWRNTLRLTRQLRGATCFKSGEAEIVIIDNHSPSHPAVGRLRRKTGVSLRRFSRNRGFASAVNEGCRLGQGEWVLLLNPDMSVGPDFLDRVDALTSTFAEQDPRAGVIGFRLKHPDGTPQASSGPFPSLWNTITGLFLPRSRRKCRVNDASERIPVSWVTGCCFLARRECLEELAGLDEDYFLYYEDADFCLRARERGWNVWFEPTLEVTHHSPLHLRRVPAALRLMTRHALLTFSRKHWPRWQSLLLGGMMRMEAWWRQCRSIVRGEYAEAIYCRELRKLIGDVLNGRDDSARARIRQAAETLEASSSAQDGNAC